MTWGAGGVISSPTRDGEREKTLQVSRLVSRLRRPRGVAPLAYSHTLDLHDPAVQRPPVVLSDRLQGVGPVLEDDNDSVSGFGGCAGAVAALGCDFIFAGSPISEYCPETCGECGGEDTCEEGIVLP